MAERKHSAALLRGFPPIAARDARVLVLGSIAALNRELRYLRLPSTSPAHAERSLEETLAAWRSLVRALDRQ